MVGGSVGWVVDVVVEVVVVAGAAFVEAARRSLPVKRLRRGGVRTCPPPGPDPVTSGVAMRMSTITRTATTPIMAFSVPPAWGAPFGPWSTVVASVRTAPHRGHAWAR